MAPLFFSGLKAGKPLAWDVTDPDTYAESHITDTVSTPGAAAHQAAQHSKILHTPMVVRSTLVGDLERDRHVGGSRPNQNVCFSVILVKRTLSPIRRRRIAAISAANRQSGGEDGCYRKKFRNFVVWAFFAF